MADADRNLLFGILALQMDFITRDALVAAMNAWVLEKTRPLGQVLVDRGDLAPGRRALLEPLVDEHIRRHGGDPHQSLAALSSVTPVVAALAPIAEPDLQASLTALRSGAGEADVLSPAPAQSESRFRILRLHARGGLGEVFVARDEELHREVALKQIQPGYAHDPGCRARFLLEAEVTGGLEHPGIVPVYGLGHYPDGVPYYAMRFIQGDSLKDAVDAFHAADRDLARDPGERALAFRRLLQRFIDVCEAVAYAHSRGVLHRDLKPGNIMLGRYGETLLVDWGLAKPLGRREAPGPSPVAEATLRPASASGSTPTQQGSALGTPAFMSPEQAAGRLDDLGPASDVYGLGATLYYLLTGRAPFEGTELEHVLGAVQRGDFPPPGQVGRSVPRALEAVCLQAMARHPGDRYASAQALLRDIEHWLADEPVSAYREGPAARLVRWARRHRQTVAIAAVLLVLCVVAGWAGLTIRQRQIRQARAYVAGLRQAALVDEQLGNLQVRTDHFPEAEAVFSRAAARLGGEPGLIDLRDRLATRAGQLHRLVEFQRFADQAERFAFDAADDDAIACSEAALGPLDVFGHDDWWDHLPVEGLEPRQVDRLRDEAYRQIILLAGVRAKEAVTSLGRASAEPHCRAGMRLIGPALRFRPDDQSARIIEIFCRIGLGEDVQRLPRSEPRSAADYYFTGVLHFWIALMPSDPITRFVTRRARELSGLDFETPQATAERYLRAAAALDPDHYWTNFWLGATLLSVKKFEAAELAFNSCTAVRPDDALAYCYRAHGLRLAGQEEGADRDQLARRIRADLDRAVALEPYNAQARLARFLAAAEQGQVAPAADEALRFLACERPVRTKRGWGVLDLRNEFQLVQRVLEPLGEDPDVLGALARAHLAFEEAGEDEKALQTAERALAVRPGDPQATLVRAAVFLRRQDVPRAVEGFQAAVAALPDDYAARNGLATVLESGRQEEALIAYEQSLRVAHRDWQRREAHQGRARALRRLGRDADAQLAEQAALVAGRAGDDR